MAADEMWLRKYRRNILHATGNGDISFIKSRPNTDDTFTNIVPPRQQIRRVRGYLFWKRFFSNQPTSSRSMEFQTPMKLNSVSRACLRTAFREKNLCSTDVQPPRKANCLLLKATWENDLIDMKWSLNKGANPNATCHQGNVSACHIAALKSEEALILLIRHGVVKDRTDDLDRTPLHFAAWAGNLNSIFLLTDSSEDQHENKSDDSEKSISDNISDIWLDEGKVNSNIPQSWYDDSTHSCPNDELPPIQKGWTPLHAASSNVQIEVVEYLLSTGADPKKCDETGCTPLDVIASSWNFNDINVDRFSRVIKTVIRNGGVFASSQEKRNKFNSPLHTALQLKSLDMLQILLENRAPTDCIDESGDTIFHVCVINKLESCFELLTNSKFIASSLLIKNINKKNYNGENVLQTALKINWLPGVHLAIKLGADVISKTNEGNTAIHLAAEVGDIDILHKILSINSSKEGINYKNNKGETALCRAVFNGHSRCVKRLIKAGADPLIPVSGNLTAIHIAAKHGYVDILDFLLSTGKFTRMINWQTSKEHEGLTALHFAASYNHPECVRLLITAGANVLAESNFEPYDGCTPLHEAVVKNNVEIATMLIEANRKAIDATDNFGWTPLHSASFFGSREAISLLLNNGSDIAISTLGPKNFKVTSIDLLMNNLSKPTEFLEDIFNSCISSNDLNVEAPNCLITIDYRILSPDKSLGQSKAIKALISTGNRFDQKRLLVHPLVESFIYLKWKSLLPLFYFIVSLYSLFVLSLNIYIVTIFVGQDTKEDMSFWFYEDFWKYVIYITASILALHELLSFKFKLRYICQLEVPVSFITIALAIPLPSFIGESRTDLDWPRHTATIALILSWLQMLLIISKFPQWGYYVQMFGKVSSIVVKVLLTFSFVIIGFSLSFMIQFHSQAPFNSPWAALIKTMVMMMSEYDYEDMFKEKKNYTHIEVNRTIFIIFLIIAGIVLVNLLVGLAVNDLQYLEMHGNIRRIVKQVEFLASLDAIMENPIVRYIFPASKFYIQKYDLGGVMIKPDNPNWGAYKSIPQKLRNAIFDRIQLRCYKESIVDGNMFKCKLDQIYDIVNKDIMVKDKMVELINVEINNITTKIKLFEEILTKLDKSISDIRDQNNIILNK